MPTVADFLPTTPSRDKVVTAAEAVRLIRDGDTVAIEGFGGECFPEELTIALEERFLATGAPRDLGIVFAVAQGDRTGRGLDRICHPGCSAAPSAATGDLARRSRNSPSRTRSPRTTCR